MPLQSCQGPALRALPQVAALTALQWHAGLKVAKAMRRYASGGAPAQRLVNRTRGNRVILDYPHEIAKSHLT